MKKHFVTFLSPGSFVAEQTTKEIESWDAGLSTKMSESITERYNAKPYGFYFTTRSRNIDELDSKEIKRSHTYYLGGKILTLEEIENRNAPNDSILISNMKCNNYDRVIENTNGWKWTQPLEKDDIVIEV